MRLNDPFTYRGTIGGLASYDLTKQYLNMMTQMLAGEKGIRYSRHKDKLKIDTSWDEDFTAGDFIVIEVYRSLDETVYSDIWNDIWLKRYTTSLIKQQWGTNLKKYGGIQLPGGTTLQGQEMYSEAKEEILQLTEELHTMWQDPPSFFVGHIGG